MTEPLPLYIWADARPTPDQMKVLQEAKAASGVEKLVRVARAIPGCERCLSFEGRPPFFCDWAETSWDDPKMSRKIAWVLTGEGGNPHRGLDWLRDILGPGVTEVASQ